MSVVMESLLCFHLPPAPCKPENTSAEQNCSSNVMTVTWTHSSTTQNYTVKATSASGVNSTCDTAQSSCSFLDLSCGQLYTFTVMGHTNVCMSEMSTPLQKLTGKQRLFTVGNISQRNSSTFLETHNAKCFPRQFPLILGIFIVVFLICTSQMFLFSFSSPVSSHQRVRSS